MKILVGSLPFGIDNVNNMKKYSMKIILVRRLILFLIASIIITTAFPILMDVYFGQPLYTGIVFLLSIIFCFISGRKILQKEVEITIIDDIVHLDKRKFELSDLQSYNFDNTGYIYKFSLNFTTKKIKLYIPLKQSGQYLELKKYLINRIRLLNMASTVNKIEEYNWYNTKVAKIYGYLITAVLVSWITIMFIYPENFKWSRLGLFLMVAGGLFPLLIRIFARKSRNDKEL